MAAEDLNRLDIPVFSDYVPFMTMAQLRELAGRENRDAFYERIDAVGQEIASWVAFVTSKTVLR